MGAKLRQELLEAALNKLVLIVAALTAVASPAAAQLRCWTEAGRSFCQDVDGSLLTGTRDALGKITWTDQYGESVSIRRDAMGNVTREYSDGYKETTRRDAMGNTIVRDSNGVTTRCRVDAMGKTRCR